MRESKADEIDDLVLELYDAAIEPDRWRALASKLTRYVGAAKVELMVRDNIDGCVAFIAYDDADPEALQAWRAYEGDPSGLISAAPGGRPAIGAPPPRREPSGETDTPIVLSQGRMTATLSPDAETSLFLCFHRTEDHGRFEERHADKLRRLLPHAERSAVIGRRLMTLGACGQRLETAMDRLDWGVLVVDGQGGLLSANAAAEQMLADSDGLASVQGQLGARRPDDAARLQEAIRRSAENTQEIGGALTIERRSGRRPLNVIVAPLTARTVGPFGAQGASVILLVTDPERRSLTPASVLQSLYRLTPAEAQVALALAGGLTVEQFAESQAKSVNTVRVQVRQVFAKMGVDRQAELIRLVLRLPQRPFAESAGDRA